MTDGGPDEAAPAEADEDSPAPSDPPEDGKDATGGMDPHVKASLLWGVVGGLSFLVLIQGYELLTPERVTVGAKVAATVMVVAGTSVLSYVTRDRVANGNERA